MIKNIVFDMGNVLTGYTMSEYICRHTDTEEERKIIKNEVCGSVEWIQMDRGILTDEEGIASICKRIPQEYQKLVECFVYGFRMEPEQNPSMECLLEFPWFYPQN